VNLGSAALSFVGVRRVTGKTLVPVAGKTINTEEQRKQRTVKTTNGTAVRDVEQT
jgi:hypothetical protein